LLLHYLVFLIFIAPHRVTLYYILIRRSWHIFVSAQCYYYRFYCVCVEDAGTMSLIVLLLSSSFYFTFSLNFALASPL